MSFKENIHKFHSLPESSTQFDHSINLSSPKCTLFTIISELNYPSIREICFECLSQIQMEEPSKTCSICCRACHSKCIKSLEQNCELNNLLMPGFCCRTCISRGKCMQCKNYLEESDNKVLSCTVCNRKMHQVCNKVDYQFLEAHRNWFKERVKYTSLDHVQIVCIECLSQYGVQDILAKTKYSDRHYYCVSIKHPSPIHRTWVVEDEIIQKARQQFESKLRIATQHQIELVLSIHIPLKYAHLTLQQVRSLLSSQEFPFSKSNDFKFLIKWKQIYNTRCWQEASIFTQNKRCLSKFFHLLQMNCITSSCLPESIKKTNIQKCIQGYLSGDEAMKNSRLEQRHMSHSEMEAVDSKGNILNIKEIYDHYKKKRKQYINFFSIQFKTDLISHLINTIYFLDKNQAPVAIFTEESRVWWWLTPILVKNSNLALLTVQGPGEYLRQLFKMHLFKVSSSRIYYKFNILIISYEALKIMGNYIDVKQLLQGCSLMVFDEKMTPLAKYYYSNIKTGRIKLQKRSQQDQIAELIEKLSNSKQAVLTQDKSKPSLTLSGNILAKKNIRSQKSLIGPQKSIKSAIQVLCESFKETYFLRKYLIAGKFPNDSERLVFLRYVLRFGMNFTDKEQLYKRLMEYQPLFFGEKNEGLVNKMGDYMGYFMAHIYQMSKIFDYNSQQEQVMHFFFFRINPKHILKLISNLERLKKFCLLYEINPSITLSIDTPCIISGFSKKWSNRFDYMISSMILAQGYGNWSCILQNPQQWIKDEPPLSFCQFLSQKNQIKDFFIDDLSQAIKKRVKKIFVSLQAMFT